MSSYIEVGDLLSYDWGGEVRVAVDRCLTCGALVESSSRKSHDVWHGYLSAVGVGGKSD